MPGMTLRAWAVVSAAGALLKSSGVASVAKISQGEYTLTLTGPAVATTAILRGVALCTYGGTVAGDSISGVTIKYRVLAPTPGYFVDAVAQVEIYE